MTERRGAEHRIDSVAGVGAALAVMARQLKLSPTALVNAPGSMNGSLVAITTGSKLSDDLSLGPVFRVLRRAGWELVAKPADGSGGIQVIRENSHPVWVTGLGGEPLEIVTRSLEDLATLINTVALANDRTLTGLVKETGVASTALVQFATGKSPHKGVRLNGLLRYVHQGGFALFARAQHASRRQAQRAAEVNRLLARA